MSIPTCVLTHKGAALQAKTPAGAQIPVTRWQMGTGILPAGEKLEDMTQLIQPLMYLPISSVTNSGRQALVLGQFVNKDMDAFDWEELGLWAQDPEEGEILYAVGNARGDGEQIEAGTDKLREFIFGMELVFSGTANVTAEISRTLVFATLKDLDAAISAHNEDSDAHTAIHEAVEAAKAAADDAKQGLDDLKREVEDVAALASSSGGSSDVGELEDTALETGSFVNTGAGWNASVVACRFARRATALLRGGRSFWTH